MLRSFVLAAVLSLAAMMAPSLVAADLGAPTDMSFTASYDGSVQRYMQLLPTDFDPAKTYDVMIVLHGSGGNRTQFATGTGPECRATRDVVANHDMVMICPDYRATTSWMGAAAEADMVQLIQNLRSQFHNGKTFITGASMGGTGSLTFAALHPNMIDGVCSTNGLANFVGYQTSAPFLLTQIAESFGGTESEVPAEYAKRSAINSPQSFTMPMAVAAGGLDTIVPPQSVLQLADVVKNTNPANPKVISFYRPDGIHNTNYVDNAVALEYIVQNGNGVSTDLHPITINSSFEYQKLAAGQAINGPIDGWTEVGSELSVANLSASDYAAKFEGPRPDGNQTAMARSTALYQFTGTTVRPGTYHMLLDVASGKDNLQVGTFLTGFMISDNNVASVADLTWGDPASYTADPGLTPGKWTTINVDWIVEPGSSAIDKYLYINFWANSGNTVYFDNVSIAFTPVPEPSACALITTALAGLSLCLKRMCCAVRSSQEREMAPGKVDDPRTSD